MKLLKKNQIVIYAIAVMLMVAGYLNYTSNEKTALETSIQMEGGETSEFANVGDARLVSSNDVVEENETNENQTNEANTIENNETTNTIQNTTSTQTNSTVTEDDYFAKSKLERDTMYSQMLESYEKVLNSSNSLETQKQTATQEITKINETKNSIMICENLLKTKGFENSVVFVNGESINVIIGTDEIQQEEVAQIQNIVSRELKAEIENIHISTK